MGSDRLHLHAGIPAADFWSLALYDALSASGLDNGQRFRSFASFNKAEANADGSIDCYLGPTALAAPSRRTQSLRRRWKALRRRQKCRRLRRRRRY